jgi:hypothetical protein
MVLHPIDLSNAQHSYPNDHHIFVLVFCVKTLIFIHLLFYPIIDELLEPDFRSKPVSPLITILDVPKNMV